MLSDKAVGLHSDALYGSEEEQEELAADDAFHHVGIRPDETLDHPPPAVPSALKRLEREPLKTVASEENFRVAGAQEPQCTYEYMRIPSTAGAQIIERSRFLEVPESRGLAHGPQEIGLMLAEHHRCGIG